MPQKLRKRPVPQSQFHRSQIGRAQRFIRLHLSASLTLEEIARQAGASPFHFSRIFLAYTAETPFDFLRRVRLATAVRMLQEDPRGSVTEIALSVGYDTPSAFNKAFKRNLGTSPREFRDLGKTEQYDLVYRLSKPLEGGEMEGKLNLSAKPEIVTRPVVHYLYAETSGPFAEVAPPLWDELFRRMGGRVSPEQMREFLGLSAIDKTRHGEVAMIYQAGVGLAARPSEVPRGLQYRKIGAGKYAQFLLTGPYPQIWIAFHQVFRRLAESALPLRDDFCIENYLNDPKTTPEDQLLTAILVPLR